MFKKYSEIYKDFHIEVVIITPLSNNAPTFAELFKIFHS